ncbi:MAG: hypothetical protein GC165_13265 [Armatimonadetes bacterium]|nr:hypothetical protein [Armatimonadota bacterium]
MKIIKSKLSIAVLSLGFVGVAAAISYATLSRAVAPKMESKKVDSHLKEKFEKLSKELSKADSKEAPPVAPHQEDIENYIDAMRKFLQTPPRDGVFGSDRIPTLHGKDSEDLTAYDAIRSLDGEVHIRSAVLGLQPVQKGAKDLEVETENGVRADSSPLSQIRLSDVHYVMPNYDDGTDQSNTRWENESKALEQFAIDIRRKGVEEDTQKVSINGKDAWIVAKAVHASVNSCYKCHSNIEKGKPIGYVAALISNAK